MLCTVIRSVWFGEASDERFVLVTHIVNVNCEPHDVLQSYDQIINT